MTTFTLIAYRPDHEESYGGYREGGTSSDLEIKECTSLDEIVNYAVDFDFNEKSKAYSCSYAEWELTLLIDGRQESYGETEVVKQDWAIRNLYEDKVKEGIKVRAEFIKKQQIEAEEERKRLQIQANIEANIRAKKYQEEQEWATYNRLKEKYDKH